MNEDEANKCLLIAKQAINKGDYDKAEKFLIKSIKLHDLDESQSLLRKLDRYRQAAAQAKRDQPQRPNLSRANTAPAPPKASEPEGDTRKFTAEDAKICNEILKCTDYYKVMGVEKTCTDNDLKKAFKKRAIKVHPDKNPYPKATDAFKKVNAAMACLSDA